MGTTTVNQRIARRRQVPTRSKERDAQKCTGGTLGLRLAVLVSCFFSTLINWTNGDADDPYAA